MRHIIAELIRGAEGYNVEIFGLSIFRLESGDYSVQYNNHQDRLEFSCNFEDLDMALDKFFELRKQNQIGFDFET